MVFNQMRLPGGGDDDSWTQWYAYPIDESDNEAK